MRFTRLKKPVYTLAGLAIAAASIVAGIAVNILLPGSIEDLENWTIRCDSDNRKYLDQVLSQRLRGRLELHNYTSLALRSDPDRRIDSVHFNIDGNLGQGYTEVRFTGDDGGRLVVWLSTLEDMGCIRRISADGVVVGTTKLPWRDGREISIRFENGNMIVKPGRSGAVVVPLENYRPGVMEIGASAVGFSLSDLEVAGETDGEKFELREEFEHPLSGSALIMTAGFTAFAALLLLAALSVLLVPTEKSGAVGSAARVAAPAAGLIVVVSLLNIAPDGSRFAYVVGIPLLVAVPLLVWAASLILSRRGCRLNSAFRHERISDAGSSGGASAILSDDSAPTTDANPFPSLMEASAALVLLLAAIMIAGFPAGRTTDGKPVVLSAESVRSGAERLGPGESVEFSRTIFSDQEITVLCALTPGADAALAFHRRARKVPSPLQRTLLNPALESFRTIRLIADEGSPGGNDSGKREPTERGVRLHLASHEPHKIQLRVENGEGFLTVDGGKATSFPTGRKGFGETVLVVFKGGVDLEEFEVVPLCSGPLQWRLIRGLLFGAIAWLAWFLFPFLLTAAGDFNFPRRTRRIMRLVSGAVLCAGLIFAAPVFVGKVTGEPAFVAACLGAAAVLSQLLVVYCNFDNSKYPNTAILLLFFLLLACGEGMARTGRYGDVWKPDFGGGYKLLSRIDWANPPGARIGDSVINSYGFRGAPVSREKPQDVFRVICMGGSTTFGDGLAQLEDTYPFKLGRKLRAACENDSIEVINTGVPAATSEQNLHFLVQVLRFSPDVIIGSFGNNDITGAVGPGIDRELFERQERVERYGPPLLERAAERLVRLRLAGGAARWLEKHLPRPRYRVPPDRYGEIIGEFSDAAGRFGFEFLLLLEPREDYALTGSTVLSDYYDIARSSGRDGLAVLVDPGPCFAARRGEKLFVDKEHPSGKGNDCVADAVFDALLEHDLLPCGDAGS